MTSSFHLYIHVPFCIRKCRYCDFYSLAAGSGQIERYIRNLGREWPLACNADPQCREEVATIFFGGGTPSLLTVEQWEALHRTVTAGIRKTPDCEWTIECNPESFTEAKALAWLAGGVNRLSVGVQSLNDRELRLLGRPHSTAQALAVLRHNTLLRFASVGADIIYGLPGQSLNSLRETLEQLFDIPVINHLSAYELALTGHTPFARHQRLLPLPTEDLVEEMDALIETMAFDRGFERYEISNYARPGHRCRHNEAYWQREPYRGLGPAAHSWLPPIRFANVRDTVRYGDALDRGELPIDFRETLDSNAQANEIVFLGLRRSEGVDEREYERTAGVAFDDAVRRPVLKQFAADGIIIHSPPFWRLTPAGRRVTDAVARELMTG
jgi:oxygen-independent coproporphyrinogen-3 oxidase